MTALSDTAAEKIVSQSVKTFKKMAEMSTSPIAFLEMIKAVRGKVKADYIKTLKDNQTEAVKLGQKLAAVK